jgi:cytochrome c
MKYLLISFFALAALLTACGGGDKKETPPAAATPPPAANAETDLNTDPVYTAGLALVKNSDCLTCHKEFSRISGPSYKEVADKYENNEKNVAMLAGKIIKGGKGVWGETEMTAHPAISKEDAVAMVNYIFKLKK